MISYLKRQGLYDIFIGASEESYEDPSVWLNECVRAIGAICLAISPCIHYLIDSVDYPKDLWTTLDRVLGKDNEDPSSYVESASSSSMISLSQDVSTSTVSDEVDHEEVTIAIDDSITHSAFSMSSIMDSEIHMLDLSHFLHASLLDGVHPSDF